MKRKLTEGQRMAQKRRAGQLRAKLYPCGLRVSPASANAIRASWARARAFMRVIGS
jgi:hypothetical protein